MNEALSDNAGRRQATNVVVVGLESVGKSQLLGSLTGRSGSASNFRGMTVACDVYATPIFQFVDTPGILHDSDSESTRLALEKLNASELVLLVVRATHLDDELARMLPLLKGKRGAVVITFWDMVLNCNVNPDGKESKAREKAESALERLSKEAGVPLIPLDARRLTTRETELIYEALGRGVNFPADQLKESFDWQLRPRKSTFDIPVVGQLLAVALIFGPAWLSVQYANRLANAGYSRLTSLLAPTLESTAHWPTPFNNIISGDYGVASMGPFLVLYALPTILIFSIVLGVYKASGLIDRLTIALHPLLLEFGLEGRDLVRVIMGFGCNVPAVINSRSCSICTRGACVSAISFGSACSYQLPATLSVFAAFGYSQLTYAYMALLASTTLVYLRITTSKQARVARDGLSLSGRDFLQMPTVAAVWQEVRRVLQQFLRLALPIFLLICVFASVLQLIGAFDLLASALEPLMALLNLPGEASVPVVLGSIRKDGIAIGLIDAASGSTKLTLAPYQVLTVVYFAGVLLPCLVTLLTVAREFSWRFAGRMVLRQSLVAFFFTAVIAWGGVLFEMYF